MKLFFFFSRKVETATLTNEPLLENASEGEFSDISSRQNINTATALYIHILRAKNDTFVHTPANLNVIWPIKKDTIGTNSCGSNDVDDDDDDDDVMTDFVFRPPRRIK